MALSKTPIPTIDVLPPMSAKVRDILYGVLAWAAVVSTLVTTVVAAVPAWPLPDLFFAANVAINALWVLGGFKAKANVTPPPIQGVDGRHEAA